MRASAQCIAYHCDIDGALAARLLFTTIKLNQLGDTFRCRCDSDRATIPRSQQGRSSMHKSIAVTSPAPHRREVRHRTAGEAARPLLRAACLAFALPAFAAGAGAETKMTVAVSRTSFAWLPLYVAEGAGLFKEEG